MGNERNQRRTWILSVVLAAVLAFGVGGLLVQGCSGKSSGEQACEKVCACLAPYGNLGSYGTCESFCMTYPYYFEHGQDKPACDDCINGATCATLSNCNAQCQ